MHKKLLQHIKDSDISTNSLLLTVMGDTVSQYSNIVSLRSFIDVMSNFGISEQLTRTSLYRLKKMGLLQSKMIGRTSFYSYSDSGYQSYIHAEKRIYTREYKIKSHLWTLIIFRSRKAPNFYNIESELRWHGFGKLDKKTFAHPAEKEETILEFLNQYNLQNQAVVLQAKIQDYVSMQSLKDIVYSSWNLEYLYQIYQQFIEFYSPLLSEYSDDLDCDTAFMLRILAIHDYRRIILKDPDLPRDILPVDWSGYSGRELMCSLYRKLAKSSRVYICKKFTHVNGYFEQEIPSFFNRFSIKNEDI